MSCSINGANQCFVNYVLAEEKREWKAAVVAAPEETKTKPETETEKKPEAEKEEQTKSETEKEA